MFGWSCSRTISSAAGERPSGLRPLEEARPGRSRHRAWCPALRPAGRRGGAACRRRRHHGSLLFETGGQLVTGNQVLVAGQPMGSVDSVELTDDAQAEVGITPSTAVHERDQGGGPLHLPFGDREPLRLDHAGPNNAPELADSALITQAHDRPRSTSTSSSTPRRADARGPAEGHPGLRRPSTRRRARGQRRLQVLRTRRSVAAERLFAELTRDQKVVHRLPGRAAPVVTAVAERRDDLSAPDLERATGAGRDRRRERGAGSHRSAPCRRRCARRTRPSSTCAPRSTTSTRWSRPRSRRPRTWPRSCAKLRPVAPARGARVQRPAARGRQARRRTTTWPTRCASCRTVEKRRARPPSEATVGGAASASQRRRSSFAPPLHARPARLRSTKLGQVTAYYDANGHYAACMPAAPNVFDYNAGHGELDPITRSRPSSFARLRVPGSRHFGIFRRCPGGATQPTPAGRLPRNPFLDDGNLGRRLRSQRRRDGAAGP